MQGDPEVLKLLNEQLTSELTAINQYWIHYRMLDNWGLKDLAKKWREESIEEMRHADDLIHRILFLDGLPNVQRLNQVLIGQSVKEILECDAKLEEKAINDLREGIAYCESVRDFISRDLLVKILADEEHHADFLHAQFTLMGKIGEDRYTMLNSDAAPDQNQDGDH